ncbi:hypothetical protein EYF80_038124 [Liparis tanakae]|uniref:Uncharacterized protein n=1 Tax=Liparis tanakae TaxID=230148 RepID=A0A4Z2GFZ1_9TELE|nr:hypothetical protein EYF80_038124 [Liparis tanakae]
MERLNITSLRLGVTSVKSQEKVRAFVRHEFESVFIWWKQFVSVQVKNLSSHQRNLQLVGSKH